MKIFLFGFLMIFSNLAFGQDIIEMSIIDSLKKELNKPNNHDTTYIKLLFQIGEETPIFRATYWDTIATEAERILGTNPPAIVKRSLRQSLADAYNNIGFIYDSEGDDSRALESYQKSQEIYKDIRDHQGLAITYINIGSIYKYQGEITKALDFFHKSLDISEKIRDKHGLAYSYGNIGGIYLNQGDIPLALEYYHKSLKLKEEIGDKEGMATTYNNIGLIYDNQLDSSLALIYYHKSLKIYEELEDKRGMSSSFNNIGVIYKRQANFPLALMYLQKSLKIYEETGDKQGAAIAYNNIGVIHLDQGDISLALDFYQKSLKLHKEIGNKQGLVNSQANLGEVFLKQGSLIKAKEMGKLGLLWAQELGFPEGIKRNAGLLTKVYLKEGNYKLAYEMRELEIQMRDSLLSEQNMKASVQKQAKFEYEKQKVADSIASAEAEKVHLANLEAEKAKGAQQQTEIAAQKKQNIFLFIGLGLVAFFGFFMYNRYKVTQKQKGIIEEKEKETSLQKDIIEEKHKEITDSINYAERIQRSFLATTELLDNNLKDYFVFFKPKDVVSGDFYWASILNDGNFIFCCADSTGHGVPGAIMSILNIYSLEKAIEKETEPNHILNQTRSLIIERLKKDGSPEGGKDGMDCSLLVLNQEKTQLTFASAYNPVFIIRNGELLEFKGDKMPVGKHQRDQEPFTLQTFDLQTGDVIYTLTDGFPDQFGGEKGKKYMIKNLKELFLTIAHLPMKEQEDRLLNEFSTWKGDADQIDDVCIIGVRI